MQEDHRSKQIKQGGLFGIQYINPYTDENRTRMLFQEGSDDAQVTWWNPDRYSAKSIDVSDPTKDNAATIQKALAGLAQQYNTALQMTGKEQAGSGLLDDIGAAIKMISSATKINSSQGQQMSKKDKTNPHPNYRPGFAGERHIQHRSGSIMNFLGPGTQILDRISRGDPPLDGPNGIDAQARQHDLDYTYARDLGDIREADLRMIRGVQNSTAPKMDKFLVANTMKAKIKAEDMGFLDKNKYAGFQSTAHTKSGGRYPDSELRKQLEKKYKQK